MKDPAGHELEVGDLVCFNASGEVAFGQIVEIDEGPEDRWGRHTDAKILVEQKAPQQRISRVGRPTNLMAVKGLA